MTDILVSIHWLAFTIHSEDRKAFDLYSLLFEKYLGQLESMGHGGRGFREIFKGPLEAKLYTAPIQKDMNYFHFEFPGGSCEAIPPTIYQALISYLNEFHPDQFKFKRIDLAFDNVPFEPQQVETAILERKTRTLATRESLKIFNSPLQARANGEIGTSTVQLGANESERMITVYNKRGETRLEFQARDKRADAIAKELLGSEIEEWFSLMLAHLLDFIEFNTDWWNLFIGTQGRANRKVTTAKEVTAERLVNWLDYGVSGPLSAAYDAFGDEFISKLVERGRKRRGSKYNVLLDPSKKYGDSDEDEKLN